MGKATPEDTIELRRRFRTAFQTQNAAGRTTDSIALELGVAPSTARNWANGQALPPPHLWTDIARVLGENAAYFLYGEDATDAVRRLELIETVAELSAQLAEVTELLRPLLDGTPTQADPDALQALGKALGRQPQDDHQAPSSSATDGNRPPSHGKPAAPR